MNARIVVVESSAHAHRLAGDRPSIVIQPMQSDAASFQDILNRLDLAMRSSAPSLDRIILGSVRIDFRRRRVLAPSGAIHLTAQEFELLRYLAERADAVVSRDELLRNVWKYADTPLTRSVDNAVARLRKKIEPRPQKPEFLHTVHGDGYCLTPTTEAAKSA